jgi:hypothetical protein
MLKIKMDLEHITKVDMYIGTTFTVDFYPIENKIKEEYITFKIRFLSKKDSKTFIDIHHLQIGIMLHYTYFNFVSSRNQIIGNIIPCLK